MFYEFSQNNSGGSFDVTDTVCHRVFIEADNFKDALAKAQDLGIYFNGCERGRDCDCCGDRWSDYEDSVDLPMEYGDKTFTTVEEYAQYLANHYGWTTPDARIFYKDGNIKEIFKEKSPA